MNRDIKDIKIDSITSKCPDCGYNDGFHFAPKVSGSKLIVFLICPDCHSMFDPKIQLLTA